MSRPSSCSQATRACTLQPPISSAAAPRHAAASPTAPARPPACTHLPGRPCPLGLQALIARVLIILGSRIRLLPRPQLVLAPAGGRGGGGGAGAAWLQVQLAAGCAYCLLPILPPQIAPPTPDGSPDHAEEPAKLCAGRHRGPRRLAQQLQQLAVAHQPHAAQQVPRQQLEGRGARHMPLLIACRAKGCGRRGVAAPKQPQPCRSGCFAQPLPARPIT